MELIEELEAISKLIGKTPMIKLNRINPRGASSTYVKLEYMNPGGSHKDRIAYHMIRGAIEDGALRDGGCVIEISSGNTATAIAWIAVRLGLKPIILLEEEVSEARKGALRLLGADVMRIEGKEAMFAKARELEEELDGVFLNQFYNDVNFRAHYETTAMEILGQMDREVDAFIMGIGTGGTITGIGKRLKEEIGDSVRIIGVIPKGSVLIHEHPLYEDRIGGLAKVIMPELYKRYKRYVDELVEVSQRESIEMIRNLSSCEGLLVGPSTGAAVCVAARFAEELGEDGRVVTIAADSLFRYPGLLKA